jgi:hypothetical protein
MNVIEDSKTICNKYYNLSSKKNHQIGLAYIRETMIDMIEKPYLCNNFFNLLHG